MANEGHIIVKKGNGERSIERFYKPIDKGSAKPAFCYPRRGKTISEELRKMERTINDGYLDINPTRKPAFKQKMKKLKERVDLINESHQNAADIVNADKDYWVKRRKSLEGKIADMTPTRKAVRDRTVNPHAVLRREKQGEKGSMPLEQMKREFVIISRALQASGDYQEANHSFLQKDK